MAATTGCPRIAQQIGLVVDVDIDKDVVRRVLAARYRPNLRVSGPSWLTLLGHAKDSLWSVDIALPGPLSDAHRGLTSEQ